MAKQDPWYEIEDVRHDRVTAVLDSWPPPELIDWKIRVGRKKAGLISRAAMRVGTRTDELVKSGKPPKRSEAIEVRNCLEAYARWREERTDVNIIAYDRRVYNRRIRVAGTLDIETEDSILDIKCSGRISPHYWLQVAMYNWLSGLNKPRLAILRLHKSLGIYEYKTRPYDIRYVRVFLGMLRAYRYFNSWSGGVNVGEDSNPRN